MLIMTETTGAYLARVPAIASSSSARATFPLIPILPTKGSCSTAQCHYATPGPRSKKLRKSRVSCGDQSAEPTPPAGTSTG